MTERGEVIRFQSILSARSKAVIGKSADSVWMRGTDNEQLFRKLIDKNEKNGIIVAHGSRRREA